MFHVNDENAERVKNELIEILAKHFDTANHSVRILDEDSLVGEIAFKAEVNDTVVNISVSSD